jgi:hypothetical protein
VAVCDKQAKTLQENSYCALNISEKQEAISNRALTKMQCSDTSWRIISEIELRERTHSRHQYHVGIYWRVPCILKLRLVIKWKSKFGFKLNIFTGKTRERVYGLPTLLRLPVVPDLQIDECDY